MRIANFSDTQTANVSLHVEDDGVETVTLLRALAPGEGFDVDLGENERISWTVSEPG